jgi:hypothetical protein
MSKTNPNESAFTIKDEQAGLTKRELFSAMLMQALNSNPSYSNEEVLSKMQDRKLTIAKLAVMGADALIAELNKEVK